MATLSAPRPRQPFGELSSSRVQALTSQKNAQNAVTEMLKAPSKDKFVQPKTSVKPTLKRARMQTSFEDDDCDQENSDPSLLSPKKLKAATGAGVKQVMPRVSVLDASKIHTSSPYKAAPFSSLGSMVGTTTASSSTVRSTAPAGRSPPGKHIGILSRKRAGTSYKRINPPSFGVSKSSGHSGFGLSIDAALSGTLSASKVACNASLTSESHRCQPKSWFFDIHEETAEECLTTMMHHSTGRLDISSDDESGPALKDDRGKENVPPPDHINGAAAGNSNEIAGAHAHSSSVIGDKMPVDRSPLSDLDASSYYADGLSASSVEVVADDDDQHQLDTKKSAEVDKSSTPQSSGPDLSAEEGTEAA